MTIRFSAADRGRCRFSYSWGMGSISKMFVALASGLVAGYLAYYEVIGLRTWAY